ncbi:RteC domain-containing protein [Chitinophaga sp. 30R24]|uniref:RteC domain-containing protein n=1 Tax=Chitinophaga sp. 30R24 TaxID=3248838 RepID=UPI003B913378
MVNKLELLDDENLEPIEYSSRGISITQGTMERLKQYILENRFEDEQSEIHFFKEVKPMFMSKLIYHCKMYDLEVKRPLKIDHLNQEKFLKHEIRRVQKHYKRHHEVYSYYKSGATHLDRQYFLRQPGSMFFFQDTFIIIDSAFQTTHDNLISEFIANEFYCKYLYTLLEGDSKPALQKQVPTSEKSLNWTASKAALIELIYALYSAGALNNGNVDVKDIANYFSKMLNIDVGNIYRTFQEIRLRKKSRTQFLQHLIERIESRMNFWDENPRL